MTRRKASENHPKPTEQPLIGNTSTRRHATAQEASASASEKAGRQYVPPPVDGSRIVQRPIPRAQADDPREFQIQQLRRRFSPVEETEHDGTAFTFTMVPTDPDFPFEMEGLECVLHVPACYPRGRKPYIDVKNRESEFFLIFRCCLGIEETLGSVKNITRGLYARNMRSNKLP